MAEIPPAPMRIMLNCYEQQLLAARRLARYRIKKRVAEGINPQDPDPSIQRQKYVKQVAEELYTSLLLTGSDNPMVENIRKELSVRLKKEVEFTYPPGGKLRIIARDAQGARPLTEEEAQIAKQMLWRITSQTIDKSMWKKPPANES